MGNLIVFRYGEASAGQHVDMNNGLTSVFINVLTLAGSGLAQTDREKEWLIWIAEHDQNLYGIGTVGFAVVNMIWRTGSLDADRAFLQRVIDAALTKSGWDRLSYTPREEYVFASLSKFRDLLNRMTAEDVDEKHYREWAADEPIPAGFPICPIHQIYLHTHGCVICNEMTGYPPRR